MRNPIDIDSKHSRANRPKRLAKDYGIVKEDQEIPASFRMQIERLRQLEDEAQPRG